MHGQEVIMSNDISYSFKCDECDHTDSIKYTRGNAPRVMECPKCGATFRRIIKISDSANISSSDEDNTHTNTLRKNLKLRQKKINALKPEEAERMSKWSKRHSGGQW